MKSPRWIYPGLRVKRWLMLLVLSAVMGIVGLSRLLGDLFHGYRIQIIPEEHLVRARDYLIGLKFIDFVFIGLGVAGVVLAFRMLVRTFSMAFMPDQSEHAADLTLKRFQLRQGPRIVAVGGGTGMPAVLQGLKEYTSNLTAIVTTADDGGSSGRLRQTFSIPAPGDIRNCLVALADGGPIMSELFQYRFQKGTVLDGHSFGNLFLTAMSELTGDFGKAVRESSRVLAIRGQVVPVTLDHVSLVAELSDHSVVSGETVISQSSSKILRVSLDPPQVKASPEALQAIRDADLIVYGPGSLYTSIIPNLLVPGMTEALVASRAVKVLVCNMMTQPGETTGYTVSDHIRAIVSHSHPRVFEYVVVNVEPLSPKFLERYSREGAEPVLLDSEALRSRNYSLVKAKLITGQEYVRHDPVKLARAIMKVLSL